jgi:hypothetical protein
MRLTARTSISHPIGLRGRCQATTTPTTAKATKTTTFEPPVASGSCLVASDSGIIATASTNVRAARTDADAGDASQEWRPPARADALSLAVSALTETTLRPDRSGNVTAQHGTPQRAGIANPG